MTSTTPTTPKANGHATNGHANGMTNGYTNGNAMAGPSTSPWMAHRSLYHRATTAFVKKEFSVAYEILESGLGILEPVTDAEGIDWRTKWDILRVTIEALCYASPSLLHPGSSLETLLNETPASLVEKMWMRSIELFELEDEEGLPARVAVTVVMAGLKVSSKEMSRRIAEEWLARNTEGRRRMEEVYCVEVLEEEEAERYLRGKESDLMERIVRKRGRETPPVRVASPERVWSPQSRSDSSSSSLMTHSTHTVVPASESETEQESEGTETGTVRVVDVEVGALKGYLAGWKYVVVIGLLMVVYRLRRKGGWIRRSLLDFLKMCLLL